MRNIKIRVQPGEIKQITSADTLVTTLGACVSVLAVNDFDQFAIMNHFMLPYREKGRDNKLSPLWYCEPAMDKLLEMVSNTGVETGRFSFHAFGGANLYDATTNAQLEESESSAKTVDALYDYCRVKKMLLASEELGGLFGRKISVTLNPLIINIETQRTRFGQS